MALCFAFLFLLLSSTSFPASDAGVVGVNWGRVANNLPSATKVSQLLRAHSITNVKLFDTDPAVLRSLADTDIGVVVTIPNEILSYVASRPSFARYWVVKNVATYYPKTKIHTIAVGNEVFVDPHNLTKILVPAMQNVYDSLVSLKLDKRIKVSSPIALSALANSYPSSVGVFREDLSEKVMKPMLQFLKKSGSYLMVNVYPFFAYEANSDVISLDYALFRPNPGSVDPNTNLRYFNLFDAQIDAVYAAMKAVGYEDMKIVVSETGWPSKGDNNEIGAGPENAAAYNGNLVRRVLSGNAGTPMKPDTDIDVYLFALFNENEKTGPTSERNYGLFYPTEEKVYDIEFQIGGNRSYHGTDEGQQHRQEETSRKSLAPDVDNGNSNKKSPSSSTTSGATWCVAKESAGSERLQAALDYACGEGGAECDKIQPGKECFNPDTLEAHASYAFNSYYQKMSRVAGTCDFQGAAYIVTQPPSYGKCEFPTGY